jgi:hypothetical protein
LHGVLTVIPVECDDGRPAESPGNTLLILPQYRPIYHRFFSFDCVPGVRTWTTNGSGPRDESFAVICQSRVPWLLLCFRASKLHVRVPSQSVTHQADTPRTATPRLWLPVFVFLAVLPSSPQVPLSTTGVKPPDLNLILQCLEDCPAPGPH